MVLMLDGDVPGDVTAAAKELDFTSDVLLYLNVKKETVLNVLVLYFGERQFPFNRISDLGLFSRRMVPSGRDALCVEISCNHGDETWLREDEHLFKQCMDALEKVGLLRRADVEDYHTRRMVHAYPRFRVDYQKRLRTMFDYLSGVDNVLSFGRQGLFTYANVDDALWMGFEVAKHVGYSDRLNVSMKELLPDYVSF
jgi:protoporphyrinogen oxidase